MINFPPIGGRPRNFGWGSDGEMWYQDANGIWQAIERPADWASVQYFLGIDQTSGYPTWLALSGLPIVRVPFLSSTTQLFPPSIARAISGGTITSGSQLFPPSVTVGLGIVGGHVASTVQLFSPSVTAEQAVTGGHISSAAQLFAPTIIPEQSVTGGHIASGVQLFAPNLSGDPYYGDIVFLINKADFDGGTDAFWANVVLLIDQVEDHNEP